jgi:hypothetical protein
MNLIISEYFKAFNEIYYITDIKDEDRDMRRAKRGRESIPRICHHITMDEDL